MYAYIKNGGLILTSDSLFDKQIEEVAGMQTLTRKVEVDLTDEETGEIIIDKDGNIAKTFIDEEYQEWVVSQHLVPGLVFDEVIEYDLEGRVCFENGSIVSWEDSEEKTREDLAKSQEIPKADPEKRKSEIKERKSEIKERLGVLSLMKAGSIELGEDTSSIESEMNSLKAEYAELSPKVATPEVSE